MKIKLLVQILLYISVVSIGFAGILLITYLYGTAPTISAIWGMFMAIVLILINNYIKINL